MRYDPRPNDPFANPYRVTDPDREIGSGAAMLLGALLIAAIGGFLYFGLGERPTVASNDLLNDLRPPITQPKQEVPAAQPQTTGVGLVTQPR